MGEQNGHIIEAKGCFRSSMSTLYKRKDIYSECFSEKHKPLFHGQIKNAMLDKLMLC